MKSTLFPLKRGQFRVLMEGAQDAPLVLVMHGFPDIPEGWEPFARHLVEAGYRVAIPSMRGYWPSTRYWPHDPDSLADDAEALIAEMNPKGDVFVVGHDWGAIAAYTLLARRSIDIAAAVTMAVPHPIAFLKNARKSPAQLWKSRYMAYFQLGTLSNATVARNDFAPIEKLWKSWSPKFDPGSAYWARLREVLLRSHPGPFEYYRAAARPFGASLARIRRASSTRITTPTLCLMGATDGCIDASMARGQEKFFEGPFSFSILEGAGHFLAHERPAEAAERVLAFFGQHARKRATSAVA